MNVLSSVAGAIMTSINMKWLFTPAGFASLIFWNLLILAIDVVLLEQFKQWRKLSEVPVHFNKVVDQH
ncbi:MAG: hypothetical protein JXR22_04355 [Prolixibacteraceae bacterium]|nr:hypothetical protein [Prolixibacteraceae bacterium]